MTRKNEFIDHLKSALQKDFSEYKATSFDRSQWVKLGTIGIHGWPVPAKYGGAELDANTICTGLNLLGEFCEDGGLAFAVAAQMLACTTPIVKYGTDEQKERLLPGICSGALIISNSITEPDTGSDVYDMSCRAISNGNNSYILSGEKTMITSGPVADYHLTYMRTNPDKGYFGGITAFIVDNNSNGLKSDHILEKMGLDTAQMGHQIYDNVMVNSSDILGEIGSGGPIFNFSMEWERACLGAIHVGTMQRILNQLIVYVKSRTVGGQAIGKYQSVAHKIADIKVRLEASRQLLHTAAQSLSTSSSGINASIAKLQISEALQQTCSDAIQIMGGRGYLKSYPFERYLRDAMSATIYSGTSEIQRSIIARHLGV